MAARFSLVPFPVHVLELRAFGSRKKKRKHFLPFFLIPTHEQTCQICTQTHSVRSGKITVLSKLFWNFCEGYFYSTCSRPIPAFCGVDSHGPGLEKLIVVIYNARPMDGGGSSLIDQFPERLSLCVYSKNLLYLSTKSNITLAILSKHWREAVHFLNIFLLFPTGISLFQREHFHHSQRSVLRRSRSYGLTLGDHNDS